MTDLPLQSHPPRSAGLTAYDRAHAATYLRLLDAHDAGATWQDAVRQIFHLDPTSDPDRLEQMHAAHLARAEWMRAQGYAQFAQRLPPPS